jgi:predicted outer membrane repeat protein
MSRNSFCRCRLRLLFGRPKTKWFVCFAAALCAWAPSSALAAVRLVPAGYSAIQDAIDASASHDTILVAPGVYTGVRNRSLNFNGVDLILISEEGAAETVIDCEHSGTAIELRSGETSVATIDGFTIRNAKSSTGAIHIVASSPTVRNCLITDNDCDGVYAREGWPKIIDCQITRNHSGINVYRRITVRGCLIADNSVQDEFSGGGILYYGWDATIENCTIVRNHATYGGGIACRGYNTEITLTDCVIEDNSARQGGALWRDRGASGCTLWRCTIRNNSATERGGAIYSEPYYLHLLDCAVIGNTAAEGGAIYADGSLVLENCLLSGNRASGNGGAVMSIGEGFEVRNCTFSGNRADGGYGGAIHSRGGNFGTSILHADCAGVAGGGDEIFAESGWMTFDCCLVDSGGIGGGATQEWYNEHLTSDPLFCGPLNCANAPTVAGDYTLSAAGDCLSPCLEQTSPCGMLIGARGAGTCGCSPILKVTWGQLRMLFRK